MVGTDKMSTLPLIVDIGVADLLRSGGLLDLS